MIEYLVKTKGVLVMKMNSLFDAIILYIRIKISNIKTVSLLIERYYGIKKMPDEFYKLLVNHSHDNKLFNILGLKDIYKLIDFLKYGSYSSFDLSGILSPIDYFRLSQKHVKPIIEKLKNLPFDNSQLCLKELIADNIHWKLRKNPICDDEEYFKIAIKMYYSIGLDNSLSLLESKYGTIDYEIIYYLFNNLNILKRKSDERFINFLFNNKKDPNNTMRLILNGEYIDIFINFDYIYNSLDYYIEKLGTNLNKNKLSSLLKERYVAKQLDNPQISSDITDDMISSYHHRYGITESEQEILEENMRAYNSKLKNKDKSSIMKIPNMILSGYTFELIPLNDSRNLVMGYRSGNCFRINGDAMMLFNNFLSNPHMRILSISSLEQKDFGMVLLMRNGNTLIAQGIELSNRIEKNIDKERIYDAVRLFLKNLMNEMNANGDEIVATIIGLSNNNTSLYNQNILPFIINPIFDGNLTFYNGINNYQGLLDLEDGKSLNDIKLFVPDKYYYEKEEQILRRNYTMSRNNAAYAEIEKILISLRFAKYMSSSKEDIIQYYKNLVGKKELFTICTLSWFITVFSDGSIDSFIASSDKDTLNTFNLELDKVKTIQGKKKSRIKI